MQQVDVVNTGLGALGKEPVVDLSPASLGQSTPATKLMRSIEISRETVLMRHGWLCALDYASLAPVSLPRYQNWRYPLVFLLPGNALRPWEIAGDILDGRELAWPEPRWEVGTFESGAGASQIIVRVRRGCEGSCIDNGALNVSYVRRANWASLSAHLADAIAYDCAARQCVSITGDKALAQQLAQRAEQQLQKAIGEDGAQTGGQPPLAPSIPAAIRAFAGNAGGPSWFPGVWDRI